MNTCTCANEKLKGAVTAVPTVAADEKRFDGQPMTAKELAFFNENAGKLICFYCGGHVTEDRVAPQYRDPNPANPGSMSLRLKYLKVIDEPISTKEAAYESAYDAYVHRKLSGTMTEEDKVIDFLIRLQDAAGAGGLSLVSPGSVN